MKVADLKEKAKALAIVGAEEMKKSDLIAAIYALESSDESCVESVVQARDLAAEKSDYEKHPKFSKFKKQGESLND
jgi:hypothetical protein